MATRSTKTQENTEETAKAQESTGETKDTTKTSEPEMVKVHNPQRFHYVQPSTGIRIGAEKTKELRNDGWLKLQTDAGVLELA